VGLNLDDAVWDATVFTKNRDRLLEAEVAKEFLSLVVEQARGRMGLEEHFTVDGSLLEAWASVKSFQPKNQKSSRRRMIPEILRWIIAARSARTNARVEKRSRSATGAQSAGKEAKLSYSGNLLVENRNGLIVDSRVWEATGTASAMRRRKCCRKFGSGRVTVAGDKGFDTAEFVRECRNIW